MRNRCGNEQFHLPRGPIGLLAAALLAGSAISSGQVIVSSQARAAVAAAGAPELLSTQAAAQAAPATSPALLPCLMKRASVGLAWGAAQAGGASEGLAAAAGALAANGEPIVKDASEVDMALVPCTASERLLTSLQLMKKLPLVNWYARFLDGPQVKPMTPEEKAWLAVRDLADPFNTVTILGSSAVAVASNSHSAYGPGFRGWGRYIGVSYSQDATGEFFGTFLIPTVTHLDPHYHRMPDASIKRRIAHVIYQVAWTQGDNGRGMLNYSDLVGFGIDDEVANLYVPGRETDAKATGERYLTTLALAPIDNAITEFLPDFARKIHVRVVLIQQIINQVANKDQTYNE